MELVAKVAVSTGLFGTVFGFQFDALFHLLFRGVADQVALPAWPAVTVISQSKAGRNAAPKVMLFRGNGQTVYV